MTNVEIAKASELMKRKIEVMDSCAYRSIDWWFFCGVAQGMDEIMIVLGYEWNGAEFVEVQK